MTKPVKVIEKPSNAPRLATLSQCGNFSRFQAPTSTARYPHLPICFHLLLTFLILLLPFYSQHSLISFYFRLIFIYHLALFPIFLRFHMLRHCISSSFSLLFSSFETFCYLSLINYFPYFQLLHPFSHSSLNLSDLCSWQTFFCHISSIPPSYNNPHLSYLHPFLTFT